jgi:4-amino-4-deoxy-L-arabinose transferase-like glycosyltransferase
MSTCSPARRRGVAAGLSSDAGFVFKLFDEGIWQTYALNVALGVATVAIVYCIALLLFERRTALVAAAAMAVWPGQVYFSSLTLSEPLFTFLFTLAVLLIWCRGSAWRGPLVLLLVVTGLGMLRGGRRC